MLDPSMFNMTDHDVIQVFVDSAYAPWTVYSSILTFMVASAFGLPIPEEIPLIGAGLVGHIAMHPERYPPPYHGAHSVNLYFLAAWCLFAVVASDLLIFYLGRFMGKKFHSSARFKKLTGADAYKRIQDRIKRNGVWASAIFRFTPGLRFPGHLACGAFGIPLWKFIAVDGTAALLSVPTQILLVGFYGDTILKNLKVVKLVVLAIVLTIVLFKLSHQLWKKKRRGAV